MNIQVNDQSPTRKNIVVTLDAAEVDAERNAVVQEFTRMAALPGFRPGKAPAAMVLKRYGREIGEELKQKVVTKAYRGALDDKKIEVLNVVSLEEGKLEAGSPAEVKLVVDVRPEFELPAYEGLQTQVEPVEATAEEIDRVVESLRSEAADFKPAERPARKGDYVKLAYEGTVDGKPIAEIAPDKQIYGRVPLTWEEVEGTNEGVIPGLGAQLAGVKAGDKKTVSVQFPAEFPGLPALAGKQASYALDIQEVREKVLPELNEAFFKNHKVDDLAGLKTQVGANLKAQKEYANKAAQRRQVTDALAGKVDFPVPQSLVESETQGVLRQFIEENMRRGVPADQFEKDKKQLFEGAQKAAAARVKMQFLLAKIAEKEKINVTEDDLNEYIYREGMRSGQRPEKLAKELSKDRERLRSIQQAIIFDKSVDFLVSKATVATVTKQPAT